MLLASLLGQCLPCKLPCKQWCGSRRHLLPSLVLHAHVLHLQPPLSLSLTLNFQCLLHKLLTTVIALPKLLYWYHWSDYLDRTLTHLEINRGLSETTNTRWSSCYDYITGCQWNKPTDKNATNKWKWHGYTCLNHGIVWVIQAYLGI